MGRYDICKYVDVFYGNGETDRFFEDGLASKWFYIKALCGNTTPHATLPFGKMSVGAYSGGYPTGYGTHRPNSCGGIKKLADIPVARGFSHLHQSGTGGMQYYYNYAIVTPFYGEDASVIDELVPLKNEEAAPGYYKASLRNVLCELTVDGGVALHRYTFDRDGGRLAIDFSNNGLSKTFSNMFYGTVENPKTEIVSGDTVRFAGDFFGVRLYFCAKLTCRSPHAALLEREGKPFGAIFSFEGRSAQLTVAFSTVSFECTEAALEGVAPFDAAVEKARDVWNSRLAVFRIDTDDAELKQKFYSNLYHSLIKPCDMTGERVLGVAEDTVTDLATLWDQYKTALPLVYLCYPEMGEKIAKGIVNVSRTLGKIPCSFGLSNVFPCEEQAKMLGVLSLCDAYCMGNNNITVDDIEECIERELVRDDFDRFLKDGYFDRYTHILDVTDACLSVAGLTEDLRLKEKLLGLSEHWKKAYAQDGLMSEASKYYEGDRYTYSFRIQKNMAARVELAGGKERFAAMLDGFFGFGGESVKQLTYIGAGREIEQSRHHRFQGFNNECDMEAPYAYIYADRHDRLCEIIHECVSRSFGLGKGGLPGNNDSGGLSSAFVWNTLGIFPISGSGEFLVGAPQVDSADIELATGNPLKIRVFRKHKQQIYVDRVTWNGEMIRNYKIPMQELTRGGTLCFYMK